MGSIRLNRVRLSSVSVFAQQRHHSSGVRTPLHELHVQSGAKMVEFAGFSLPVSYSDMSVSASHVFTRQSASIFDVSHMLQTNIRGKNCVAWFETLCPVDLQAMPHGTSALTVFLNEHGGIIDDLIVTKVNDEALYVVSNAGRLQVDKRHMKESSEMYKKKGKDVSVEFWDASERALIAVQGPKAVSVVQSLSKKRLKELWFMQSTVGAVAGVECRLTRCGYTGEDGMELSMPAKNAVELTEALLNTGGGSIRLAGLGARDSLRLEAGLCLYGNDIDETVTPIEAGLAWLVAKRRRTAADFPGAQNILSQIKSGVMKRRVGLRSEGPPARKEALIKTTEGVVVGKVTSGCPSPSLGGNVAMGYVSNSLSRIGTDVLVNIRGKDEPCIVTKMPFVPSRYYINK